MATIQVLLDESGAILGTTRSPDTASGESAPEHVGLLAGPGQQLVEIEVADGLLEGSPAELHAHLRASLLG
ncbi:hypothetical protein A6A06_37140 [Streptomyces sp. CB02923]|uniref:hypothetical protein n=1 Tax=Streptomyces sp. CB02923 TaxID=1718985 RepID=UPI00093F6677|nr:hypothetical protein [Streptomyces sp. CB02923]OKI06279.1 hypothetical protein A6A06_37140 [Streptomyces sp. CB02923]